MRPPRPCPSWRRAMSRSIASRSSSRPAGRPSTTATRPGPWDSPAVVKRSCTQPAYWPRSEQRHDADQARAEREVRGERHRRTARPLPPGERRRGARRRRPRRAPERAPARPPGRCGAPSPPRASRRPGPSRPAAPAPRPAGSRPPPPRRRAWGRACPGSATAVSARAASAAGARTASRISRCRMSVTVGDGEHQGERGGKRGVGHIVERPARCSLSPSAPARSDADGRTPADHRHGDPARDLDAARGGAARPRARRRGGSDRERGDDRDDRDRDDSDRGGRG